MGTATTNGVRSDSSRPRRVLIRTFPPSTNANYGGILQAWALQRTLSDLGYEAIVDSTRTDRRRRRGDAAARRALTLLGSLVPWRAVPSFARNRVFRHYLDSRILSFAPRNIPMVALYRRSGEVDAHVVSTFGAFVAGSDQVWRPRYVHVPTYLFDFLPDEFAGPRVAYAASFGTESPEFDDDLIARTAPLARSLTAASVRESIGVQLCRDLWGIDAVQMPDPTTLVDVEEYRAFASDTKVAASRPYVASYLIDRTPAAVSVETAVSRARRLPARDALRRPNGLVSWRTRAREFRKPAVEEWLALLSSADTIVTDSFHGCVFAVLFERPFVVVANEARGRARFESFLSGVGLLDRLVTDERDVERVLGVAPDWSVARAWLSTNRTRARSYLRGALDDQPPVVGAPS